MKVKLLFFQYSSIVEFYTLKSSALCYYLLMTFLHKYKLMEMKIDKYIYKNYFRNADNFESNKNNVNFLTIEFS